MSSLNAASDFSPASIRQDNVKIIFRDINWLVINDFICAYNKWRNLLLRILIKDFKAIVWSWCCKNYQCACKGDQNWNKILTLHVRVIQRYAVADTFVKLVDIPALCAILFAPWCIAYHTRRFGGRVVSIEIVTRRSAIRNDPTNYWCRIVPQFAFSYTTIIDCPTSD